MTNEELMQMMTDMGLHEGGMENWVVDNAWLRVANAVEKKGYADAMGWKIQNHLEHLPPQEKNG